MDITGDSVDSVSPEPDLYAVGSPLGGEDTTIVVVEVVTVREIVASVIVSCTASRLAGCRLLRSSSRVANDIEGPGGEHRHSVKYRVVDTRDGGDLALSTSKEVSRNCSTGTSGHVGDLSDEKAMVESLLRDQLRRSTALLSWRNIIHVVHTHIIICAIESDQSIVQSILIIFVGDKSTIWIWASIEIEIIKESIQFILALQLISTSLKGNRTSSQE